MLTSWYSAEIVKVDISLSNLENQRLILISTAREGALYGEELPAISSVQCNVLLLYVPCMSV